MLNPDKKHNIFITGMMGTGKSTLGSLLAKKIAFKFIDTDDEIEDNEVTTISKIFESEGEKYFRNLEHDLLKEIIKKQDQVIATGGGMLIEEKNMKLASENGFVIYLHTPLSTIHDRISEDSNRPLLHGDDLLEKLTSIFEQRKLIYNNILCSVDTTLGDKEEVVDCMINKYQEWLQS